MPIEWVVLIAGAALSALTGPPLADAYAQARNKVRDALSEGGPLAKPLSRTLEEACRAFIQGLEGAFHIDQQTREQLREVMEDEAFVNALAELPFVPFRQIDTRRCRELFVKMGPQGADEGDFDAAWHFLGRRFRVEAAASEPFKNLLDLSAEAVREERDEALAKKVDQLVALAERLVRASEATGVRDDEPAIRHYRAVLYERYRYADTRGLFMREKEGPGEGIELKDVFVETLLQRVPEGRKKLRAEKAREREEGEWEDLPAEELPPTDEAPQPIAEILRRERLAVVLGAPGSGKSTLMRCLSMALCRPEATTELLDPGLAPETVPILFELKEFASALLEKPNRQLDRFLIERWCQELPGIEALLSGGRALVLLDGLDEVFDEAHRRWVSDEVWRLAMRFPRTRFVLTSRPHGYQAAPLPGPVPRWRVVPFDDERIGRFFRGWFQALAREGVEVGAQESPQERAAALTADVLARPRIREMAQNPMLCTLIVLVHRSRTGRLPERRVVFYEAAVRTLVEFWERAKHSPVQPETYEFPEPELLIHALAEVAWRAFHELGRREIPGERLRAWLRESLKAIAQRLVDDDRQVRLAAVEFFARVGADDKKTRKAIARRLADHNRNVRLAAVDFFARVGADDEKTRKTFSQLLADDDWNVRLAAVDFFARVGTDDRETRKAFAQRLADRDWHVRRSAVDFFARVGTDDEETRKSITQRLADDDWNVHLAAVDFFARVGTDDEGTRRVFAQRLADDDWNVRLAAVDFFARVGTDDKETRKAIAQRLADDSSNVHLSAVNFFARVGTDDEETRKAFAQRLADRDWHVRLAAVDFFARVGTDDEETRKAIAQRLADDASNVRLSAMEFFARVGTDDEETRRAMAQRLASEEKQVQLSALRYFLRVGFTPVVAKAAWKAFSSVSRATPSDDDRNFSKAFGKFAATQTDLLERMLREGPKIRYFRMDLALAAVALERDRQRRLSEPIEL